LPEGIGAEEIVQNLLALDPERRAKVRSGFVRPRPRLLGSPVHHRSRRKAIGISVNKGK
jgi:hypothetical protein